MQNPSTHSKIQPTMKQPHDNWARFYDFVYEQTFGSFYINLTPVTIKSIREIQPQGTIIDFGAGTGRLTFPLAEHGYSVIAVEKSNGMVEEFKRKLANYNFDIEMHNCSICDFNNGMADLAIALFTVLTYSTTEDELSKNIKNICDHIKPNGYFFFDLPNPGFFNVGSLINIKSARFKRNVELTSNNENNVYTYKEKCSGNYNEQDFYYEDEFSIRYWDLNTLENILSKNGFKDTLKIFNQFNATGSTYKLYQKQ